VHDDDDRNEASHLAEAWRRMRVTPRR
jgi:hypothetical protein